MGCPFAGRATRHAASGERVTVRICSAVPYERDDDPPDLPLPSVCFSEGLFHDCYHYRTMLKRKEISARLGLVVPLTLTGTEVAPEPGTDRRAAL
jgi:hypothetical protein